MPNDLREQINAAIEQLRQDVEQRLPSWSEMDSPMAFCEMELKMASFGRQVADGVSAAVLKHRLADDVVQAETSAAAHSFGEYRSGGRRWRTIRLYGGGTVRVEVEYLKPNKRGLPGRPRGSGKRGKGGKGLYPALVALGIAFGASPALAKEVCCQSADSDSFRTGLAALKRRGIDLGHKPTHRLVNRIGARVNTLRHKWLGQKKAAKERYIGGQTSGRGHRWWAIASTTAATARTAPQEHRSSRFRCTLA